MFDEFNVVEDDVESAMSKNPRRGGRFIPMIRYLEKTTVTTSSVITRCLIELDLGLKLGYNNC